MYLVNIQAIPGEGFNPLFALPIFALLGLPRVFPAGESPNHSAHSNLF